jgi:hypothetical protein
MEQYYKLNRLKELAGNDRDFMLALAEAFLEEVPTDTRLLKEAVENESYLLAYQIAHKMKPTIDVFELGVLSDLIDIQDWGKFQKKDEDVSMQLSKVVKAVEFASTEIKEDFEL